MVATMAGKPAKKKELSTLNVDPSTRLLIGKIAAYRDITVGEVFLEKDVVEFFTHLLAAEVDKEGLPLRRRN
jgi:hypothetical protein